MSAQLLSIETLNLELQGPRGRAHILRGVDLTVERGEVLGVVGESGCGKTMTGRTVMGLQPESALVSGRVSYDGRDLLRLNTRELRRLRGRRIAMVFQDPSAALNPVFTIGQQLRAVLQQHQVKDRGEAQARSVELLREVGLPDPERTLDRYPHELSGGMQQRAMIAFALAGEPDLLIADEPTTALDVTIQAQILALLLELREKRGVAVILISHDIAVVAQASDRLAVLYAGTVVEQGPTHDVLATPRHPYTQALIAALPTAEHRRAALSVIPGRVPSGYEPIQGCVFADRCPHAMPICATTPPEPVTDSGVTAACWLLTDLEARP
jgi:peptide/nickel transport system ATP-binding protein